MPSPSFTDEEFEVFNSCRHMLINRRYGVGLTPLQDRLLAVAQECLGEYRQERWPLPIQEAEAQLRELKAREGNR